MHLTILWFCVLSTDGATTEYIKYLNRVYFDCKTKLCLGKQGKYILTQECFYLRGIFNDINEEETSFLDCNHKHMMKSGAPPDKVGALHHLKLVEFHGFSRRIDF